MTDSQMAAAGDGGGMSGNPDEMSPMMEEDEMMESSESSSNKDSSFKSSSSFDSSITVVSYDDDKFIWDQRELDEINKRRKNNDKIPIVYRDKNSEYGIRANQNMNFAKCCYSLILPWHNEWVVITLYLVFAIYFWIQLILISFHNKYY
jgi:hypothetical protein